MAKIQPPSSLSTFRRRRRTPGSFLLVPCPRLGRSIRCQGQLEAAAAVTLAACPLVRDIQEQPAVVWYRWSETAGNFQIELLDSQPAKRSRPREGAGCSYIVPDFLVAMTDDRKRLVEVKASPRLARPLAQRKLAVARLFAARIGATFYLVTEKELFSGPLVSNLRLLGRYANAGTEESLSEQLAAIVPVAGISLVELALRADTDPSSPLVRMHVFHLLAVGRLSFDPRLRPMDNQTILFPQGAISWDPFDSVWAPSGSWTGGPSVWSASSQPIGSSPKT
ncbi:MAG: TnsA endonuclease N-terminal domain-containing protein [Thermoguttaceae bacterium]|jgi:hypothetical protein